MSREYFAVTITHRPTMRTFYTKHIFNNQLEAIQMCEEFQEIVRQSKMNLDYGVEPISEEDKKRVESGEVVYL